MLEIRALSVTRLIQQVQFESGVKNRQCGRKYTAIWLILQTAHALLTERKTATQVVNSCIDVPSMELLIDLVDSAMCITSIRFFVDRAKQMKPS